MLAKFIGKPDEVFPNLITGKSYWLEVKEIYSGILGFLFNIKKPLIIHPIVCPYSSWTTFEKNWEILQMDYIN